MLEHRGANPAFATGAAASQGFARRGRRAAKRRRRLTRRGRRSGARGRHRRAAVGGTPGARRSGDDDRGGAHASVREIRAPPRAVGRSDGPGRGGARGRRVSRRRRARHRAVATARASPSPTSTSTRVAPHSSILEPFWPPTSKGGDEPTRAIEIKPKCGYVHHLNPHGISRFRMHQALRVARGEASRASGYDPLDLFAVAGADADADVETNAARARRALRALAADPRNNLRAWISSRGRGARRVEGIHDGHAAAAGKGSGSATGTSDAVRGRRGDRPRRAGSFARPRARARRAAIGRHRRGARGGSREGMGVDGGWRARGGDASASGFRRRRDGEGLLGDARVSTDHAEGKTSGRKRWRLRGGGADSREGGGGRGGGRWGW